MCWISLAVLIAPVVALCAWRYFTGKWPLRFDW
jgi:hypothetical protein